jgi:RimJ/RimL family protein N-acetyltransferase
MAELPQLETERLVLRPPTVADLGPLHEIWGDRDVMRYVGAGDAHAKDVDESEGRLARLLAHQERRGFSLWIVADRESGTVLGDCGLIEFAFRGPEVELAYRIGKAHWGKGYATEAARAWTGRGLGELGLETIVAVAHPENGASQRVLEKVGFRYEGPHLHEGVRMRQFRVRRNGRPVRA